MKDFIQIMVAMILALLGATIVIGLLVSAIGFAGTFNDGSKEYKYRCHAMEGVVVVEKGPHFNCVNSEGLPIMDGM